MDPLGVRRSWSSPECSSPLKGGGREFVRLGRRDRDGFPGFRDRKWPVRDRNSPSEDRFPGGFSARTGRKTVPGRRFPVPNGRFSVRSRVRIRSVGLAVRARYDNRKSGRAQTLRRCGFKSHPCYGLVMDASAGHWRAQVAVTHPPSGSAGSTPARRTDRDGPVVYRQGHHPLKVEMRVRLPSGLLHFFDRRVAELGDARASVARARPGRWCSTLPPATALRVGRCPAESHKLGPLGSTPRPATLVSESPGRQTGKAAGLRGRCLWVRLPPRRLRIVPSSSGQDACLTHRIAQVRVLPGRLGFLGPQVLRAARLRGREAVRVRLPGGPFGWRDGLLVQQQDACLARRRSGCDSPAVHLVTEGKRTGERPRC